MPAKKPDRRVQRTRQLLQDALISLTVARGYERVTVQHILDRAGVGRSTFYVHFRSKEELLRSGMEQLRALLVREWKAASGPGEKSANRLGFTLAFFRHVDSHRQLYRAIVGRESGVIVEKQLRRMLGELVREDLISGRAGERRAVGLDLAVQYVVGALLSVMTWWMDYKVPLSPEEMNRVFRQLTFPGLDATLPPGP